MLADLYVALLLSAHVEEIPSAAEVLTGWGYTVPDRDDGWDQLTEDEQIARTCALR